MKAKQFSLLLILVLGAVVPAPAKDFPEPMYLIMISPEPGKAGPMSWMLVANPDIHEAPPNMMKKKVGGPFRSQEEVIANKDKLQIISLSSVATPVYDSTGQKLPAFLTLIPPSNTSATTSGSQPSDAPLTGNVGFSSPSAPPAQSQRPPTSANDSPFTIQAFTGDVEIFRGADETITIRPEHIGKFKLRWDDRIVTGMDSSLRLSGPAEIVEVGELTDYKMGEYRQGEDSVRTRLWLKAGEVSAEITHRAPASRMDVQTPTATLSSRGTKFRVSFDRQKQATRIDVEEGEVEVTPKNRDLAPRILSQGQWCIVYPDRIEPADAGRAVDASKLRGLSAEKRVAQPGTQITIPVLLKNVTTDAASGLGNINFEVTYDASVASVAGRVSRGNIYGNDVLFEANANEPGRIRIGFAGPRGVTQSGTVAQIPFKIVGRPGQQTELALKVIQSQTPNGQTATLPTTNGRITIPDAVAQKRPGPTSGHVTADGRVTSQPDGTSGHIGPGSAPATAASSGSGVTGGRRPDGSCGIAGDWEYHTNNTVSKFTFTPDGKGGYGAQQYGYGQVAGTATIQNNKLRIDWRGYTSNGYNEFDIDSACSSGTGKCVVLTGDFRGEYPSTIRRTSVAPERGTTVAKSAGPGPGATGATTAAASGVKGAKGPGGVCGIAGDWEYNVNNTVSKWTFTPDPKGGYGSQQYGYGQVNGPATIKGNTLRIDWRGYASHGYNEYEIDAACSSGTGKSVVLSGDFRGEYPSTIRRLTVAPEGKATVAAAKSEAQKAPGAGQAARAPGGSSSQPSAAGTPSVRLTVGGAPARPTGPDSVAPDLLNPDSTVQGDCDGNNVLTSMDAECALQMSVGSRPLNLNLDVDRDGSVLSADARRILQEATVMMGP